MSKHTFKDRLIAGLLADGWTQDRFPRSTKYATFTKTGHQQMFVGTMGALRYGTSVSGSRTLGDPSNQTTLYIKYLAKGDGVLNPPPTQPSAPSGDGTSTLDSEPESC